MEVCFSRAWGTVCDSDFGQDEAEVVCRQLDSQFGYAHNRSLPQRSAYFGEGVGPIFIENLGCSGFEEYLSDCIPFGGMGCDHSQDAGVFCEGTNYIRIYINHII